MGNIAAKNEIQSQKLRRNISKIKRQHSIVPKNLGRLNSGISIAFLPQSKGTLQFHLS
jgi:hypothetical protein